LVDRRGTKISIVDVGYGISQILPIIIKSFSYVDQLILIEQPESQLHPKLQANLADIFALSNVFFGNSFIIETHSENLILRYQRRIRELSRNPIKDELDFAPLYQKNIDLKPRLRGNNRSKNLDPAWLPKLLTDKNLYHKIYSLCAVKIAAVTINPKTRVSFKERIILSNKGDFIGEWPDGFFEERFQELGI